MPQVSRIVQGFCLRNWKRRDDQTTIQLQLLFLVCQMHPQKLPSYPRPFAIQWEGAFRWCHLPTKSTMEHFPRKTPLPNCYKFSLKTPRDEPVCRAKTRHGDGRRILSSHEFFAGKDVPKNDIPIFCCRHEQRTIARPRNARNQRGVPKQTSNYSTRLHVPYNETSIVASHS